MNQYQLLAFALIAVSIYLLINLKFQLQRYINVTPEQAIQTLLESKKDKQKNQEAKSRGILSSKAFYIASGVIGGIAFLLLLISLFILNMWFVQYNLAEKSVNWLPLEAVVTEKGRQGGTSRSNRSSISMYYADNVYYTFQYKGKKLKGQRLSYDNGWATSNASDEGDLLKSVPKVGTKITIYYNEKTGESVMFPGRQFTNYTTLIITTPLYIVGVAISFFAFYTFLIGISIKQ